jgi:Tol biopolymer transport system component
MTVKQRVASAAMRGSATVMRGSRLTTAVCLSLTMALSGVGAASAASGTSGGAHGIAALAPDLVAEPQVVSRLAYVTDTAKPTSTPEVWVASASGGERKRLGPGLQPLLAPNGQSVAVSLFGATVGEDEHGPSIGIYPVSGAPISSYLSLETATATPLAWSPDSRYLAVERQSNGTTNIAAGSGLDVIDTQTGTVTPIAAGTIYGASFARDGSDRLVFGLSHSEAFAGGVNVYMSQPSGAGLHPLSNDGRSLNPVWGAAYIAYDRERTRHLSPEYQIWLASQTGARLRRLTHVAVGPLVQGLVPLAFSANGSRLLAEFEGQDTSGAYAVALASGRARSVTAHGLQVQGAGISSDGRTLLVDEDAFEQPPSHGHVATVPFAGGRSKVLVAHGSQASWND